MNWNETLRNNVTRAQELKTYMRLTSQEEEHMTRILEQFPMTVTRYYLSLIDWNNPEQDPVFRMSIPSIRETDLSGDFDTSGEADNTVLPGLQHKYRQTALILSTHRCAMYCRHCSASGWWESPAAKQPEMWTRWLPTSSPTLK